jgi:chromosomal replication initiation ATPase DnaA
MAESFSRNVSIYFCHRYSGARLREIGDRFGMSDAAVSQASRRLRVVYENDAVVKKQLEQIKCKLGL